MKKYKNTFLLEKMAQVLRVSRSSDYYPQEPSKRSLEHQEIVNVKKNPQGGGFMVDTKAVAVAYYTALLNNRG